MNKLDLKEGQTYICSKSDQSYWTEGKEYKVVLTKYGTPVIIDNEGDKWAAPQLYDTFIQFKLKYSEPKYTEPKYTQPKYTQPKYTQQQINQAIVNAHILYDKDSQVLAYIEGYFAK
ncbi:MULTISPECIES: hypothetical protein [Enterococcus]|uniref:hypothetical protein n=1 Tax=Enterococcus TaxID=1350 RepID=UPI00111705FA|nr:MULTISPECIES: hypothetical protein [Enterococcus]MDG4621441.1 hypothetical protein [Enterococcus lactis]QDA37910.1 hypothetical protein FHK66_04815 [Enterococcus faecium]